MPVIGQGKESEKNVKRIENRKCYLTDKAHGNCQPGSEIDCRIDQKRKQTGIFLRKVFPGENNHRTIEYEHVIDRAFLGTFSFVVNDPGFRKINILITAFDNPVRQINVFAVHEKCFIQQSDLIQSFLSHQHKSSGKNFNLIGFKLG
ncbi:hypothetical protein D3C71_1142390 [compost metagenome]